MKLQIDLKSLVIGILLGLILVLVLGAGTNRTGVYQCTIANEVGTQRHLFVVLNTQTGNTRISCLNTGPGHLVLRTGIVSNKGIGSW